MLEALKKPGCEEAFISFWDKSINIVRYAGLGVAAVEVSCSHTLFAINLFT